MQTTVALVDDLDGSKAVETISFGLDGVPYEIDLHAKNAKALRNALGEFVAAGRRLKPASPITTGARQQRSKKNSSATVSPAVVRVWAHSQGIEVAGKGRVPAEVWAQFTAAQI